jgi:hypothetical protein
MTQISGVTLQCQVVSWPTNIRLGLNVCSQANIINGTTHFRKCKQLFEYQHLLLETSGDQSSNLYLNVVHFFTLVLIRLKTVFSLHWCTCCSISS